MEEGKAITSQNRFRKALAEDVLPLIEEYCYGDYAKMSEILGTHLVDVERQTLRYRLLENTFEDIEDALLQPYPAIQKPEAAEAGQAIDLDEEADEEGEA